MLCKIAVMLRSINHSVCNGLSLGYLLFSLLVRLIVLIYIINIPKHFEVRNIVAENLRDQFSLDS